ncbi:MAG: aminotransferase class V-fold PLP-dependent enzyme [Actinomycetota bacterium]|nr:aminotransferase class V-fold PLP-dependent enzyme [Actinomycetota bacterium]
MTSELAQRIATMPPAPPRAFASDNAAGAHPAVIEAIVAANSGHALAYGGDRWTAEAEARFRDLFGPNSEAFLVWNGTGANVMALATMVQPADFVLCTEWAHIAVDETGAPERALGVKIMPMPAADAKLNLDQIEGLAHFQGNMHHAQPGVVSITQSTELGTVYTADEVAALCDAAHRLGMVVHMDGARLANATAALGGTVAAMRSFTVDAGVDVLSFGGTKAGLAGGEAVVYLNPALAKRAKYVRKQVNQLPSKMRFVAAQFNALLEGELWIHLAEHANSMGEHLYQLTSAIPSVVHGGHPAVNSVFPTLPSEAIKPLQDWCFFWDWDVGRSQVRWMTSWDTTIGDVEQFAAGVRHLLG